MKLAACKRGDVLKAQLRILSVEGDGVVTQVVGAEDLYEGGTYFTAEEVQQMVFMRNEAPTPEPFVKGDRVVRGWAINKPGEVLAVDGDQFWVRWDDSLYGSFHGSELELAP